MMDLEFQFIISLLFWISKDPSYSMITQYRLQTFEIILEGSISLTMTFLITGHNMVVTYRIYLAIRRDFCPSRMT